MGFNLEEKELEDIGFEDFDTDFIIEDFDEFEESNDELLDNLDNDLGSEYEIIEDDLDFDVLDEFDGEFDCIDDVFDYTQDLEDDFDL